MADWYYKLGDHEFGPMDSKQLRQLAASKRLQPTDHIRRGSDGSWVTASSVKGLFPEMAGTPTAPVPIAVQAVDTPQNPASVPTPTVKAQVQPKSPANIPIPIPVPPSAGVPSDVMSPPPVAVVAPKASSSESSELGINFGIPASKSSGSASTSSRKGSARHGGKNDEEKLSKKKKKQQQTTIIIGASAGVLVLILVIVLVVVFSGGKKETPSNTTSETANTETTDAPAKEGAVDEKSTVVPEREAPATEENELPDLQAPENSEKATEEAPDLSEQADATTKPVPEKSFDFTQPGTAGDWEIKIVSVKRGQQAIIKKGGAEDLSEDRSTIITLTVKNTNGKTTPRFTPWSVSLSSGKKSGVVLSDELGNSYPTSLAAGSFPKGVEKKTFTMYADEEPVTDILVFKRYVPAATDLYLELPVPGNVKETITFKIPIATALAKEKTSDTADKSDASEPSEKEQVPAEEDTSTPEETPAEESEIEFTDDVGINGISDQQRAKDEAEEQQAMEKELGDFE